MTHELDDLPTKHASWLFNDYVDLPDIQKVKSNKNSPKESMRIHSPRLPDSARLRRILMKREEEVHWAPLRQEIKSSQVGAPRGPGRSLGDGEISMTHSVPGLVICHITMERSTMFHGKHHYFYGDVQ